MVQPLGKIAWQVLTKLNMLLPYDPTIALLGIYLTKLKTYVHIKKHTHTHCTWIFAAALFIITKNWK